MKRKSIALLSLFVLSALLGVFLLAATQSLPPVPCADVVDYPNHRRFGIVHTENGKTFVVGYDVCFI